LSERDLTELANEFLDAFNVGDFARFRAVLADDVEYRETGTGRRVVGEDAYVRLCEGWRRAFPDVRGEVRASLAGGDTVAQDVMWTGTHSGPLEGAGAPIGPTGRRVEVPGAIWLGVRGGKLQTVRHHLDVLGLLQQLGVLPAPA
jgi:steroid delta-isomerase-like uncharacterized protein